ncbi:MAG: amidohydrolase family protein, partial [Desulfobacteraceae bacterium]|nr:amidohydrolase family protein [Desulfobacteraceae bacterium]
MRIRIKGARVLDPGNLDEKKDILVNDAVIESIMEPNDPDPDLLDETIDAKRLLLVPGLMDIHVHLREPGHEYKETIETGLMAAAKGGFTSVCSMPNTRPVNDNSQVTKFIINRAKEVGFSRVYPVGAISQGLEGISLAEIYDMQQAGIKAITDDGMPVKNSRLMRRAL